MEVEGIRRYGNTAGPLWILENTSVFLSFGGEPEKRMAVDRVQSEPISGQFPLTGNRTEKFSAFAPNVAGGKPAIPLDIRQLWRSGPIRPPFRNRELLISYQGMIVP